MITTMRVNAYISIMIKFKLVFLLLTGFKNPSKSVIGFWTSEQVYLDGESEITIWDTIRTDYSPCPRKTIKMVVKAPQQFNWIFEDDGQYAIFIKFEVQYTINHCWRTEKSNEIIKFMERGMWAKEDRTTIVLFPTDSLSFLSPDKFPYTCTVADIRGGFIKSKTLQLKCIPQNWEMDPFNDGDINYRLKTVEITAREIN